MGLFNRPTSVSTGAAGSSDKPADMFSHSQTYNQILADKEQRRKEKLEKQERKKDGKRRSDEGTGESPGVKIRNTPKKEKGHDSPKRRRISSSDINGLLKESGMFGGTIGDDSEDEQIVMEPPSEKMSSPRKKREVARLTRSSSKSNAVNHDDAEIVEVGESSGDEAKATDAQASHQSGLAEEEDEESDEELAALARQARQRRLQQTQSATPDITAKSSTPQATNAGSPQVFFDNPLPDPAVKILIVSRIDNTNPLLVYRKLSQNLNDVRRAWCQRQGFDQTLTERVFLIHRTRRVYDVTTVRSLGLETDHEGNITMNGAEGKEGVDQVALEAVTEDIFASILAEKAREEAKRLGQWDPDSNVGTEDDTTTAAAPAAEELIGIVLKAKGKPDFKLKVKPSTPFSKIINACRKTFQVPDGSSITLDFDGDQLEPDATVNSTEISDLDVVDVHVS